MAYKVLSQEGKNFITNKCDKSTELFKGRNGILPYSNLTTDSIWEAKPSYNPDDENGVKSDTPIAINTNSDLAQALIVLFNRYAKIYDLDANIIAAQAYHESNYRLWYYPKGDSTASGISQFSMLLTYDIIVKNNTDAEPKFSNNEIATITTGLSYPLNRASYEVDRGSPETINIAKDNRPILLQNVMNNPEIMIKAQCRYMKSLAIVCKNLASSTLFSYDRGATYAANTYSKAIEKAKGNKKKEYHIPGVDYVLNVFTLLKNNFGKDYIGTEPFDAYNANVSESDEFNIKENDFGDLPSLSNLPNYKYIYFPENQYNREKTPKNQIVLHHTVSGPSINGDVYAWESKGDKVATSFLIGRDGIIYQTFSTDYWAWHLGVTTSANSQLNKHSIGIELDSWGGLVQSGGNWYPADYVGKTAAVTDVVQYPNGFRGYYAFEKYTNLQLVALKQLMEIIKKDKWHDIPLTYQSTMWTYDVNNDAMSGKDGVWGHVSYRPDKSDPHPQEELITMLNTL